LELEQYFGALGDVKQVRMRRKNGSNEFKGSVFVEYATLDEANKVGSSKLQYNGQDLLVMTK
jgi:lupus La protein